MKKQVTQLQIGLMMLIVFGVLSLLVFQVTNFSVHLFLIWNALLASVSFFISSWIVEKQPKSKWVWGLAFLVSLLFLPNAIYMVTDLMYLNHYLFYEDSPISMGWIYAENIVGYIAMIHLFLGALLGLWYAIQSIRHWLSEGQRYFSSRMVYWFLPLISFVSSVAVYLGRFLRLNSWDVILPWRVVVKVWENIDLVFFEFVGVFTIFQILLFGTILILKKHHQS